MTLEILYQDEYLVAINKPHDLLVHASPIARNADEFAVQILRDQINQKVFPCHRLDRKTGGVLLFALSKEINAKIQEQFVSHATKKTYQAIVRGFTKDKDCINYALTNDKGKTQEAITRYKTIKHFEIDVPFGQFLTSRYSHVFVFPETGRFHQIRKHFAHIFHPIIADRPHGCNKQNKLWKEKWQMNTMLLHASNLTFTHPISHEKITIEAPLQNDFREVLNRLQKGNLKETSRLRTFG